MYHERSNQIIALYDDKYLDLFNQRSFFDREWLSEDRTVMSVPWPNIVEVGIMHIANTPVASLNEINLLTLGKFITILYPPQLEEIPSSAFTSRVLPSEGKTSILSPLLTPKTLVPDIRSVDRIPYKERILRRVFFRRIECKLV